MVSIALLGLFLFNAIGTGCWLLAWKEWVAERIERGGFMVGKRDRVVFEVKEDQKIGNEFSSGGQMYDVVSTAIQGNKKIIRCYRDNWESDILQTLGCCNDNAGAPDHNSLNPWQFLQLQFTFRNIRFLPQLFSRTVGYSAIDHKGYTSISLEVASPPPWLES